MNETHTWSDHCKNILLEDSDDIYFSFASISSVDKAVRLHLPGIVSGQSFPFLFHLNI